MEDKVVVVESTKPYITRYSVTVWCGYYPPPRRNQWTGSKQTDMPRPCVTVQNEVGQAIQTSLTQGRPCNHLRSATQESRSASQPRPPQRVPPQEAGCSGSAGICARWHMLLPSVQSPLQLAHNGQPTEPCEHWPPLACLKLTAETQSGPSAERQVSIVLRRSVSEERHVLVPPLGAEVLGIHTV